jgi:nucleoid-associated protein YgaU
VVNRRQKLLAASLVLAAGVALSWPLRRAESLPSARLSVAPASAADVAEPATGMVSLQANSNAGTVNRLALPPREDDRDPFADLPKPGGTIPSDDAPVFRTVSDGLSALPPSVKEAPAQIHVVHEGDSLGRLAKRYLGDEGRALEIFDLNRDVLDNPHVLRIGVELRIPGAAAVSP